MHASDGAGLGAGMGAGTGAGIGNGTGAGIGNGTGAGHRVVLVEKELAGHSVHWPKISLKIAGITHPASWKNDRFPFEKRKNEPYVPVQVNTLHPKLAAVVLIREEHTTPEYLCKQYAGVGAGAGIGTGLQ